MIRRIRDYSKREPSRDAHKIYIICEGKGTEPNYFAFFEGMSSNLEVITIPPTEGTDPLKLLERAKQVLLGEERKYTLDFLHRDTVWFVIDTDTWEKEGKITPLREFCAQQNVTIPQKYDEAKSYSAWNVAQSNPSFEIWLYYHFYDAMPTTDEVEKHASFKEYVDNTIAGGFNFQKDPVRLEDARDHGDGSHDPFEDEGAIVDLSRYSVRWSTRAMTFSLALPHRSEVTATVQNHRHQLWHNQQGKKWITRTVPVIRERGEITKEQLIAKHFTDEIDRACFRRWLGMKGAALERELEKTMNTLFFQLPHIIFPQKLLTAPGGSRDSENFNLRHKSRDEIIREMIDEGYNMKLS